MAIKDKEIMFSVVIPAYNCEKTISESVKSINEQSRNDLIKEIIIVDDGSNDSTVEIITNIKKSSKIPINLICQKNSGPSCARNKGIKLAVGNWIALLDSDDKWTNDKIEKQYNELIKNKNIKFLGAQYPLKILFKERKGLVKLSPKDVCIRSMPNCSSVIFEKETAIKFGLFRQNMKYCEDANFFQKYFRIDSYYVLAENLTILGIQKNFFGERGLSSNYKEIYKGKKHNMEELENEGLISRPFLVIMKLLCDIKLIRREIIRFKDKIVYHR